MPIEFQACAIKKLSGLRHMEPGGGEYHKLKNWIDIFMQIPFDKYNTLPVSIKSSSEKEIHEFMKESMDILDQAVYGMSDVKLQIMQLIGQWITNPESKGMSIAIKGPPGTGKTTLVKDGISKILKRYFALVPLGGNSDGSDFIGHGFTYEGAKHGIFIDILIKGQSMNPCILFDELDKLSDTPKGGEIKGILTHLTDNTQNDKFQDKYFSEIDFNLSKGLYFFTYNDESKIDPILKDRLYCIETKGYSLKEKRKIAISYLIPIIRQQVNIKEEDIIFTDEVVDYIVQLYTKEEKGVRNLKRSLEIIFTKLNLYRLMEGGSNLFEKELSLNIKFPLTITTDLVQKLLNREMMDSIMSSLYI